MRLPHPFVNGCWPCGIAGEVGFLLGSTLNKGTSVSFISCVSFGFLVLSNKYLAFCLSYIRDILPKPKAQQLSNLSVVYGVEVWFTWVSDRIPYRPLLCQHGKFVGTFRVFCKGNKQSYGWTIFIEEILGPYSAVRSGPFIVQQVRSYVWKDVWMDPTFFSKPRCLEVQ